MIIVDRPAPVLIFDGDLDLNGDGVDPSGVEFRLETAGPSAENGGELTWGEPEAVTQEITAQLGDGSLIVQDGASNRVLVLPLRVKADSQVGLAAGEAALQHRCGDRSTTLEWTPPVAADDTPVTTVFVVKLAELAIDADMVREQRYTRYYTLTLTAEPYTRSTVQTLVAALESVPTSDDDYVFESIDDCTSTSGWVGSPNAVALGGTSDESVAVEVQTILSSRLLGGWWNGSPRYTLTLTRTGTVDMSDSPYLVVKAGMPGVTYTLTVTVDGVELQQVAAADRTRTYVMPDGVTSFDELVVEGWFFTKRRMTTFLRVYDVSRSSGVGTVATGRQTARTMWIDGAARTNGSISVQHETDGLGDVVLYTVPSSPAGYVPAMAVYQTDGPVPTSDTDAVSGVKQAIDYPSYTTAGADPTYTIPGRLLMEGTYGILMRVKVATPEVYQVGIHVTGGGPVTTLHEFADTEYALVWVGSTTLPPRALPDESDLDVVLTAASLIANGDDISTSDPVYLDELWLFNLTDGAVSIVSAGSAQRVWFDSPDEDRPYPTILVGSEADRSDAIAAVMASVGAVGRHRLLPGLMDAFTVTTGASDAVASTAYYRRWGTQAAG